MMEDESLKIKIQEPKLFRGHWTTLENQTVILIKNSLTDKTEIYSRCLNHFKLHTHLYIVKFSIPTEFKKYFTSNRISVSFKFSTKELGTFSQTTTRESDVKVDDKYAMEPIDVYLQVSDLGEKLMKLYRYAVVFLDNIESYKGKPLYNDIQEEKEYLKNRIMDEVLLGDNNEETLKFFVKFVLSLQKILRELTDRYGIA